MPIPSVTLIAFAAAPESAPWWTLVPFVAMLAAIAGMPFIFKHHWERFYHYWSVVLGGAGIGCCLAMGHGPQVGQAAHEYVGFMALIGALFVVAGGIYIGVKGQANPWVNVVFLLAGAILANLIGTTGASMLLIRPWIRMNRYRITGFHIVFFIFIVSNVAGCLTPIGDPPLFLGYLNGVPFWWVLFRCWKPWMVGVGALLAVFSIFDVLNFRKALSSVRESETGCETWRFEGGRNVVFLSAILGAVFIERPVFLREGVMLTAAAASWLSTPKELHRMNDFSFGPIKEVGWIFLGVFATMIPALDYLHAHALGLHSASHFYWVTGSLSGFLDNAPTYMAFLAIAFGAAGLDLSGGMRAFILHHDRTLMAISVSSVFFGAMTYIGNGPNFMVKAIAERAKVKPPDFFRYLFFYAVPILLPVLYVVGVLFFR